MKEIVVISGKGGTGKTSLTGAFAILGKGKLVLADCDVDAADLHLLLKPEVLEEQDFSSGFAVEIDQKLCIACGKCESICQFEAISHIGDLFQVSELNCEGCGYCARICPARAISMVQQNVGKTYLSRAKTGDMMVHARLHSGADNSGKLVARVKQTAKEVASEQGRELILVDGSPGIGCPVVSSLSGATLVVLVTEPTVSGLHDLKRVYELVQRFRIPAACIINKADLNPEFSMEIGAFLRDKGILHLKDLPYNEDFTRAMTLGQCLVEYQNSELTGQITDAWDMILNYLKEL